jgi:phasin family protein
MFMTVAKTTTSQVRKQSVASSSVAVPVPVPSPQASVQQNQPSVKEKKSMAATDNFFEKLSNSFSFYGINNDSYRKNLEAVTAANQLFLEYFQALHKRHQQITQEAFADFSKSFRDLVQSPANQKLANGAEIYKHAFEKAIANAGELAEVYARSSREAVEIFTKRANEIIDEVKDQIKQSS